MHASSLNDSERRLRLDHFAAAEPWLYGFHKHLVLLTGSHLLTYRFPSRHCCLAFESLLWQDGWL